MKKENAWKKYTDQDLAKLEELCTDYKKFLTVSKTEREATKEIISSNSR